MNNKQQDKEIDIGHKKKSISATKENHAPKKGIAGT